MTSSTRASVRSAGDRAVEFCARYLRHVKGEWAGEHLVLAPWQEREIVRPLFDTLRADGLRQYRTVYIEVPRKNGKSTLGAALALYLLFCDGEPGAEIYSAAVDREQAAIIFDLARRMVEASTALRRRAEIYRRSIVVPATGSVYRVLSADVPSKHGLSAHAVIFDEVHAQRSRELWDVLQTSMGARRQPVMIGITTAGYDRHSLCWELHEYARQVREGTIDDPTFLPVIYAAPEGADWTAEETWRVANPSYGVSIKPEYLREQAARAREIPGYQNTFRRLHLNEWTEQETRWLDLAVWDRCAGAVDEEALRGRPCYAGLDLSSTTDLSALVLVFPLDDGTYAVLPRFWVPRESMRRRTSRDRVPYDVWVREGWIEATEGEVVDYDVIRARIHELASRYRIREVAIDRWNAAQITTQLQADGLTVCAFGQGFASMSAPSKALEAALLAGRLRHGGHPVLRWMAGNVVVVSDPAGNIKPAKDRATERIDGIVALIMALGRATAHAGTTGPWLLGVA